MTRLGTLVFVGLVLASCASDGTNSSTSSATENQTIAGDITVSAASSLTEAFAAIGADFEAAHPDATVDFNFGSSATLATQIERGAPADAFASADTANIDALVNGGLVSGAPTVIARNELVIVTKPGNPENIRTLSDLATVGIVALCAETVPCGAYADQALTAAGVTIPTDTITRGQDVKVTLGAVTTGDADAAIVYVTDAWAAGPSVTSVTIPDAQNVIGVYSMVVLKSSGNAATAETFVKYVASNRGWSTLAAFGFVPRS